jgi:hypothetical protein
MVQGQPRQIVHKTSSPKIIRPAWTGDAVQVVECLLCKLKALSLNSSPTKIERISEVI